MRLKKGCALLIVLLLTILCCAAPFGCAAVITTYSGTVSVLPGNTRSKAPIYNYAWLDTVVVRDDALAIMPSALIPKDDYPYSLTVDEFISESEQYMVLFDLDVDSVNDVFLSTLQAMYYTVIALGLSGTDYQSMYDYLADYGININSGNSDLNELYATVLYSCIKNDSYYLLYGEHLTIPKGITLEHATVIYLAEALNIELPSGVDTLTGLSLLVMRSYIADADLPISANPDKYESFYWAKIAVAAAQNYKVPTIAYDEATKAQLEYVDYAYCSSILKVKYGVTVNPVKLYAAMNSDEGYAVQKLILKTMLDERGIEYQSNASVQQLFASACKNGYFALEEDFYSDIYNYDVFVDADCEKLWLSPFSLADQLDGGSLDYVTIAINGTAVKSASTTGIALNKSKSLEKVTLFVAYNDGALRNENAVYTFNVHRSDTVAEVTPQQDLIGSIESYISSAIPTDNVDAQERVSNAFDTVRDAVGTTAAVTSAGVITTYPPSGTTSQQVTSYSNTTSAQQGGTFTTFADEKESSTYSYTGSYTTYPAEETSSAITRALNTMAQNPVATATPISLIAVGTALGIILNRRRKNNELCDETSEDNNNQE